MKLSRIIIIFIVVVIAGGIGLWYQNYQKSQSQAEATSSGPLRSGMKFPNITISHLNGERFEILGPATQGRIVVVNFWASWCAPCVNEVPELIDFVKRVTTKNSQNLKTVFITVSLDETPEDLNKFLKSFPEFNKEPFVRVWDKDKSFSKLVNADRLPMTVILNKNIPEPRVVRGVVEWKSINF